jgi:hypothetical protein
VDHLRAAS